MNDLMSAKARAELFTGLHVPGRPIVLPNAWDAASAWIIQQAGAAAVATSSAAIAWSLGCADGNAMSRQEAAAAIARIARAVDVPVTADIETGYGESDDELAATIRAVLDAGAVGVNLEDSGGAPLWPIEDAAHRILVARRTAEEVGIPLHINARTDVYFARVGPPEARFAVTLDRAAALLAAGANSIFVPGVSDLDLISQLTRGIDAPVNILAGPASGSVAELAEAGVGRISTGSSLATSVLSALRGTASAVLGAGSFAGLAGAVGYRDLNDYFVGR